MESVLKIWLGPEFEHLDIVLEVLQDLLNLFWRKQGVKSGMINSDQTKDRILAQMTFLISSNRFVL